MTYQFIYIITDNFYDQLSKYMPKKYEYSEHKKIDAFDATYYLANHGSL